METLKDKLYDKAANYCAKSEHCASEVRAKLQNWQGDEEVDVEAIVDQLYAEHFLSDERYCVAFVRDKFRFNHWGKAKIRAMLLAKRLDSTAIETALDEEIDEEEYLEMLSRLINEKLRTLKADDPQLLPKLYRFVAGRGFDYDSFKKAVRCFDL
ncbi:MAG: regulatory protein RecX [Bacteroidales bacterium]|nr:regulatory protein RecX [Bacteroidales bacterium]